MFTSSNKRALRQSFQSNGACWLPVLKVYGFSSCSRRVIFSFTKSSESRGYYCCAENAGFEWFNYNVMRNHHETMVFRSLRQISGHMTAAVVCMWHSTT